MMLIKSCDNCGTLHDTGNYAYEDWKDNDILKLGYLCNDCWIIVYKEGEYVPH